MFYPYNLHILEIVPSIYLEAESPNIFQSKIIIEHFPVMISPNFHLSLPSFIVFPITNNYQYLFLFLCPTHRLIPFTDLRTSKLPTSLLYKQSTNNNKNNEYLLSSFILSHLKSHITPRS